ncbi:unnamed protein product, partial [Mesorhabditis belari]|uniref:26S proteasome non-ATPase regulatory subunit 5 n=1 Tax=Mesorhabditis belari TaxID=2138241 RepID=A0AAF3J5T7_9BILA
MSSFSLELLDLIEAEKYSKAKEKIEDGKQNEIDLIAADLLLRIGSCFGHEKRKDLEELMQTVLRFGYPTERVAIGEQLIRSNHSIHLYRILLAGFVVDFDALPDEMKNNLRKDLPQLIEENVLKILEQNEEQIDEVAALCAHLFTFSNYTCARYDFADIVGTLVRALPPTTPSMATLLIHLSERRPFHPVLQHVMAIQPKELTVVPQVFSKRILQKNLALELGEYLEVFQGGEQMLMVDVTISALQSLTNHIGFDHLDASFIPTYTKLFGNLLKICQDFELNEKRVKVMRYFAKILDSFDFSPKVLILKRLIALLSTQELKLDKEALVIAWMIDLYRRDLRSDEFKAELGSIWSLLFPLRYHEMIEATSFYVAVYCLAQQQALMKCNPGLMKIIEIDWLKPVHQQLSDFVELIKRRQKDKPDVKNFAVPDYDTSNLNLLISSMEMTENYVKEFLC